MRYPVKVQVFFSWHDGEGHRCQGEGTSRDMSETGAFVLASACPPPGANLELRVCLTALPDLSRSLNVEFEGRVLRTVQNPTGDVGFAVFLQESSGERSPDTYQAT
jgi:PilZ domain